MFVSVLERQRAILDDGCHHTVVSTEADPDIEEGGGIHRVGLGGHAARAASPVCCARIITQSVVWGSGGMLP